MHNVCIKCVHNEYIDWHSNSFKCTTLSALSQSSFFHITFHPSLDQTLARTRHGSSGGAISGCFIRVHFQFAFEAETSQMRWEVAGECSTPLILIACEPTALGWLDSCRPCVERGPRVISFTHNILRCTGESLSLSPAIYLAGTRSIMHLYTHPPPRSNALN